MPQTKTQKILLLFSILLLISIFLGGVLYKMYLHASFKEQELENQWKIIESAYERRLNLVQEIIDISTGLPAISTDSLKILQQQYQKYTTNAKNTLLKNNNNKIAYVQQLDSLQTTTDKYINYAQQFKELKAHTKYREIISRLKGSENRLKVEKLKWNKEALKFNELKTTFPNNFVYEHLFLIQNKPFLP